MNNYYTHFERFNDGSLLHIGVCDDKEDVKIFDIVKYNDLNNLCQSLILYVSNNKTEDCNLWFHNYDDDKRLINEDIRGINDIIIKPDDASFKDKGNESGKATVFLKDSRRLIDKNLNEFSDEFKLNIKNDNVINESFFTQDNYNKSVPITEYTEGLIESEINNLSSYVVEKQTEINNSIDLTPVTLPTNITFEPVTLPTNITTEEPIIDFYINQENLIIASQPNDNNIKFNPTNVLIESTSINTKLLKKGLATVL